MQEQKYRVRYLVSIYRISIYWIDRYLVSIYRIWTVSQSLAQKWPFSFFLSQSLSLYYSHLMMRQHGELSILVIVEKTKLKHWMSQKIEDLYLGGSKREDPGSSVSIFLLHSSQGRWVWIIPSTWVENWNSKEDPLLTREDSVKNNH